MIRTLVLALAVAACPAAAGAQSFASIFTQLPSDFRHLAQPSNLLILGSTGASSLALHPEDESIALKTKDAGTAVREFRAALASGASDKAAAHCDLGESYLLANRPVDAKREALAALEIAPSYERAQELLLNAVERKS